MAARKRTSAGPRPAGRVLRISEYAANRAVAPREARLDPFTASHRALHPPGVGKPPAPGLAMDDAYSEFAGTSGWSYGGLSSAIAEGQIFLGYPTLAALMQRVEYMNALASIADDMTRKWIEFKASAGVDKSDRIKALKDKFEAIKAQAEVKNHVIQALGFGRSHLYLDTGSTDNRDELKTDLGFGARSAASALKMPGLELLGLRPIEPVWVSPHDYETSNPLKPNWYKPNAWHVMAMEVHASRLLTTIPFPVSDLLKPAYSFGGLPLVQLGKPYVDNWLNVRQATADIAQAYSIFVLATDLSATLAGGAGEDVDKRVKLFNKYRSNKGTLVIDKNAEDFKNISANIAGIEAIQAASQEHMSAAWRIPLVKLTGISPSGLNASSEGEVRVYYDLIKSMQEQIIRPHLQIIMDLCSIELFGDVDGDITFEFTKLFETTELEAAQIRTADAQTGSLLIQGGVIATEEERARVADDPDSPYMDLDPLRLPEQAQPQPGEEGYQGKPDNWATVMSGIADHGGLLPPPAPDNAASNEAWSDIMSGVASSGGVHYEDGIVAASPGAWMGLAAGLKDSGGVQGPEPKQAALEPGLRLAFGKDGGDPSAAPLHPALPSLATPGHAVRPRWAPLPAWPPSA